MQRLVAAPCTLFALAQLALLVMGCAEIGPDYRRPSAPMTDAYRGAPGWAQAQPSDATSRGPWYAIYGDHDLDRLEAQVAIGNQNLRAAEAAYRQARAAVAEAQAGFFPTLGASGSVQRQGQGGGLNGQSSVANAYAASLDLSWTIDLWGRIRRAIESAQDTAQASAADLANARLSLQASLASTYFQLRIADALTRLLVATQTAYQRTLTITRNQYLSGIETKANLVEAQSQVESVQAQMLNAQVNRAQLEHAIAVLTGVPPARFALPAEDKIGHLPVIPVGVPSRLLERRPDIAAAERGMAAANASIGVAIGAYYPTLTLTASYGVASSVISSLVDAASRMWAVGPGVNETLFDGGLRRATVEAARAAYDQQVAIYRQTVLTAFQQVEDNLSALQLLAEEAAVQERAVMDSDLAVKLILNQYQAGTVAYTSVLTAQELALANQQTAVSLLATRLTDSVALIQALGGGWNVNQLPDGRPAGR